MTEESAARRLRSKNGEVIAADDLALNDLCSIVPDYVQFGRGGRDQALEGFGLVAKIAVHGVREVRLSIAAMVAEMALPRLARSLQDDKLLRIANG